MRLINADAYLGKVCTYNETGCGSCRLQVKCPFDEPTVEAIPIEWIKQYGEQNWFDFGTQFNAITCMLKAWEERKEE